MPMAEFVLARDNARSLRAERRNASYPLIIRGPSGDVIVEAMFRRAMTAPRGGDQKSEEARSKQAEAINTDIVSIDPKHGNSRAYTLDRLQRERPELFAQVEAGKLSANAAAIQAGFRKKLTPFERVQKLLPELTAGERRWLWEELSKESNSIAAQQSQEYAQ
jgi:hypothetical protein